MPEITDDEAYMSLMVTYQRKVRVRVRPPLQGGFIEDRMKEQHDLRDFKIVDWKVLSYTPPPQQRADNMMADA